MTEVTIVALSAAVVAAIPPTIVAYASLRQSQLNARKSEEISKQSEATEKKADTIIKKAEEIHTLTNSSLSKLQAAFDVANEKIVGLEKLVSTLKSNQPSRRKSKK